MTLFRVTRITVVPAFALALLAACGEDGAPGDGGGPPDPPPPPVADSATVRTFADGANALMQSTLHQVFSNQQFGTPDPFLLPEVAPPPGLAGVLGVRGSPRRVAAAHCVPVVTGIDTSGFAIDSDGDEIPDDFSIDYGAGCTELDSLGNAFTFSGGYRLQDIGNGILDFSYTPTDLTAMVRDTLTGHFVRQRVTSVETAHVTAGHAAHQMDATREVTIWAGGDTLHALIHTVEGAVYDPDAGSSFTRHGRLQQGTLALVAVVTFRDLRAGTDSVRFVYSTPTAIHTSFDCGTGIDAGRLLGLLEGDERVGFRFTWTGCITPIPELFGTTP